MWLVVNQEFGRETYRRVSKNLFMEILKHDRGNTRFFNCIAIQRQMDAMGYAVIKGTVQDATFITSDPGRNHKKEEAKEDTLTPVKRMEFDHELLEMAGNMAEMKSKAKAFD